MTRAWQRSPVTTYDESLDVDAPTGSAVRRRLGTRRRGSPIAHGTAPIRWWPEATRHYTHGIGDDNPCGAIPLTHGDPARPAGGPAELRLRPEPHPSGYAGGLPGIHAMWAGADLTWHRPLLVGTEIRTTAHLKDLVEHQTRFAGRAIQQIYHVTFSDAADGTLWPRVTPGASARSGTPPGSCSNTTRPGPGRPCATRPRT